MCYIKSVKNLTLDSVKNLFPDAGSRHYQKGQIICYHGDKPQHIFFVARGHIRYYDIDEQGNEKVLHLIGPNNIFPMLFAFGVTEQVDGFYSTIEASDIVTIPLQEFIDMTETNIKFSNSLTRWFLTEINQLVYRISSLEKTDAKIKIMYALKYLTTDHGSPKGRWQRIDFPVTQQFIADFTGLTRETVSATMQELNKDKVIRTQQHELTIKRSELEKLT